MRKIGKMVSGAAVLLMLAAACGGKEGHIFMLKAAFP